MAPTASAAFLFDKHDGQHDERREDPGARVRPIRWRRCIAPHEQPHRLGKPLAQLHDASPQPYIRRKQRAGDVAVLAVGAHELDEAARIAAIASVRLSVSLAGEKR